MPSRPAALATALAALLLLAAAPSSGAIPSSPGATRLCTDQAAGTLTVEVLGDSIMAGTGASAPERTWGAKLNATLGGSGGAVWMAAQPGAYVRDYLPGGQYYFHTQFVGTAEPSVIMADFRINDAWMSVDHSAEWNPNQFRADYTRLLDILTASSPTSTLIIVNPMAPRDPLIERSYPYRDYLNILWDLKVRYSMIWLDLAHYFPPRGEADPLQLLTADGHATDAGQHLQYAATHRRLTDTCS